MVAGDQDRVRIGESPTFDAMKTSRDPSSLESGEERGVGGTMIAEILDSPRAVEERNESVAAQSRGKVGVVRGEKSGVVRIVEQSLDAIAGLAIDTSPTGAGSVPGSIDAVESNIAAQFDIAQLVVGILGDDMNLMAPRSHEIRDIRRIAVSASIDVRVVARTEKNKAHRLLFVATQH